MSTSQAPFLPETAPFSPEQRAWLNGFLAGLFSRHQGATPPSTAAGNTLVPLTLIWGSQTGTAEGLAKRAAKEAGRQGFAPIVLEFTQVSLEQLATFENLLVITSTYGDGEPPDNAKAFWRNLREAAHTLPKVRYSVCAIGDSNYALFCQFGKDVDARLEKLGALRVLDRTDCDVDYEEKFTAWLGNALAAFGKPKSGTKVALADTTVSIETPVAYTRTRPYPALVKESRKLNGEGSSKAVHHVVFDLQDAGLAYSAGDALGVWPLNCPELVSEVLEVLGFDGEEEVPASSGGTASLRHALTTVYDLVKPTAELQARLCPALAGTGQSTPALPHVIDVLKAVPPPALKAGDFVRLLRKIQPRLYSISSSPLAHPGEVHLTVGAVRYDLLGRARKGICSTYLADRVVAGETQVGVFIHTNASFRPPQNPSTPMIMVGPGTGIAPFRAFLEEREAKGATGKNWLFFGDQRAATDFLYRDQLEHWCATGLLTRLDTAFSRDQAEKIYVQQRMLEAGEQLYAWLEAGAHFYVCGDASRMAKDVDNTLHLVVERFGRKTREESAAYVENLRSSKRYVRDVY
ncbi:MAG: flavodoxin domain-containing protein [Opitutaceae bacterium]|nr:flavodoxin domain-containing protein [Opitutaceae bacterium]